MPAFCVRSPNLLASSTACIQSAILASFGTPNVEIIICFRPSSLANASRSSRWSLSSVKPKWQLSQPGGVNLVAELRWFHLCERPKAHLYVAGRRAHLDPLEPHTGQFLQCAIEILPDGLPDRPRLAPDRQAQWIGA